MNKYFSYQYHRKSFVNGFTLTEIIVSLAISAVLISLVIKLFILFTESQKKNDKKSSDYEELFQAEKVISDLILNSDSIHYEQNYLTLFFDEQVSDEIAFYETAIIIKTSNYTDTFHISTGEIRCNFIPYSPQLVKSVFIPVNYSGHNIVMSFEKEYEGAAIVKSQTDQNEN